MTENLDLDIDSSITYTSQDTDLPVNTAWVPVRSTYVTDNTTWISSNTTPESYNPGELCWNGTIRNDWDGTLGNSTIPCIDSNVNKHYSIGNYYNWTAAVAMNNSSDYTTDQQDVDQSICPAGWRLPTYNGNKSYQNLVNSLSPTAGRQGNIQSSPVYFVYGGIWYGKSWIAGSYGVYWTSVVYSDYRSYRMAFDMYGGLNSSSYDDRFHGDFVRCVAR